MQLEKYARLLKQKNSTSAYAQLSANLLSLEDEPLALATLLWRWAHYDYTRTHYGQAEMWLDLAQADPVLADYALYWRAENDLAAGRQQEALTELKRFRSKYPDSAMTEQALQSLGEAALASKQSAEAVAALNSYALTSSRPALLFLRGQAHEMTGQLPEAVADYQALYLRYPLSEPARQAFPIKLGFLQSAMGDKYPALPIDQRIAHALTLFTAKGLERCAQ